MLVLSVFKPSDDLSVKDLNFMEEMHFTFHYGSLAFSPEAQNSKLKDALLLVFSVTPFKLDQNKNQNLLMDKVQNLRKERR